MNTVKNGALIFFYLFKSNLWCLSSVLRIRIRDPALFWPPWIRSRNPLEVFPDPGFSPYFLTAYYNILGEKYLYSLKNDSNLFLYQFKIINIYNLVKTMATEKGKTTNVFPPPLFIVGIRDPGWEKIRIRSGINIPDSQHCLFLHKAVDRLPCLADNFCCTTSHHSQSLPRLTPFYFLVQVTSGNW